MLLPTLVGGETRITNADLAFREWDSQIGCHRQVVYDLPDLDEQEMIKLPKKIKTEAPNWDQTIVDNLDRCPLMDRVVSVSLKESLTPHGV